MVYVNIAVSILDAEIDDQAVLLAVYYLTVNDHQDIDLVDNYYGKNVLIWIISNDQAVRTVSMVSNNVIIAVVNIQKI